MVAPIERQTLTIRRVLKAPPELVFDVWTQPQHMLRWFSPAESYTNPFIEVDLRVGGSYRIAFLAPDGVQSIVGGRYLEIAKPDKLVFTWKWEDHDRFGDHETTVSLDFIECEEGTELVMNHKGLPVGPMLEEHNWGWQGTLGRLEQALATL